MKRAHQHVPDVAFKCTRARFRLRMTGLLMPHPSRRRPLAVILLQQSPSRDTRQPTSAAAVALTRVHHPDTLPECLSCAGYAWRRQGPRTRGAVPCVSGVHNSRAPLSPHTGLVCSCAAGVDAYVARTSRWRLRATAHRVGRQAHVWVARDVLG